MQPLRIFLLAFLAFCFASANEPTLAGKFACVAVTDSDLDVMRRWQATIARLAAKITSIRTYDLPMDGRVLFTRDEDWHVANETQL
jgi:hypothetical protein